MLTEYSELRQEIRNAQGKQTSVISLYVTILAAIFAAAAQLFPHIQSDGSRLLSSEVITVVFIGILPLATAFIGIIYLDQVYRQVKLGAYVSVIEQTINQTYADHKKTDNGLGKLGADSGRQEFFQKNQSL